MIGRLGLPVVAVMWPAYALAQYGPNDHMENGYMHGYGYMYSWGGMIAMWLFILLAVGLLIYFLVRASSTGGSGAAPHETPLDILKKRYARGEIIREQFEEMKKDL